jgi:phosphatidylglycerol lysyltransferase
MPISVAARAATGTAVADTSREPAIVTAEVPSVWPGRVDVAGLGRSSVAPFVVGDDREVLVLADGGVAGFVRCGRWAVFATDPATPPGTEGVALDEVLERVRRAALRPIFAAVTDPGLYLQQGLRCRHAADDPLIDLTTFSLAGKRLASIRHSVASARRGALTVEPFSTVHAKGCATVSASWLATKRGGELGFTLGRFDPAANSEADRRVVVDRHGDVVAFVTWHRFDGGRARVLDLMRRSPDAPNPAMDLAIADSLIGFAESGVDYASLGCVPVSHGRIAERIYATRPLHRYKHKFDPVWQPRYLAAPRHASEARVMLAIARAYCPAGVWAALRRND